MDKIELIKKVRKELHNNPEHSGAEEKTKDIIRRFLSENTDLYIQDFGGGIIALYESGEKADCIALRADFDAVSLPDGSAAHLCGHDGHTAALLGVALMLSEIKPKRDVLLIFQPAEETGEGAKAMLDALDKYYVSEIYGIHNLPGLELGQVYTSLDTFACASCGMTFKIQGRPAHAAYPELGASPLRVVNELLKAIDESQIPDDRFSKGTFATLIGINAGQKAFGTSAENAEVWVTVRSRTDKDFREIKEYLECTVKRACEIDGLTYSVEIQDEFSATVNDKECAEKVLKCCGGKLLAEPMRWSEDFGHYLNNKFSKGAFIGIGAGECPGLHTKDYEYPDNLLEYHIKTFIKLITKLGQY